ncbi:MAG: hypothetical protein SF123_08055 [Chloroflexota bacterium]|nr:hypothetical protein [Chloroflexota bacterium]
MPLRTLVLVVTLVALTILPAHADSFYEEIVRGRGDHLQHYAWDINTATLFAELPVPMSAFSHDMRYAASSTDGIFRLWRLR